MKKLLLSLAMLLTGVGAWAQEEHRIFGLKSIPTEVTVPADITTGYYLLKEVNPTATGKPGGYLKAVSEANNAVVTPQGSTELTTKNADNTYIWYIEKDEANSTYTIATVNKVAAWQEPGQRQKNLVAYASKAALTFTTEEISLGNKVATPIANSFIVQNAAKTACVHYSDNNLGSWTDANPESVMMFHAYKLTSDMLEKDIVIDNIRTYLAANENGNDTRVGSYTVSAHNAIKDALEAYDNATGDDKETKLAEAKEAYTKGEKVTLSEGDKFRIKAADASRGYVVYSTIEGKGSETTPTLANATGRDWSPSIDDDGVYSEWAFVIYNDNRYLYNVYKKAFIKPGNNSLFEFSEDLPAIYQKEDKGECKWAVKFGNMYMETSPGFGLDASVRQIANANDQGAWFYLEKMAGQVEASIQSEMKNRIDIAPVIEWRVNNLTSLGYVGGYAKNLQSEIESIATKEAKDIFIAQHANDIIPMTPGYYYIKGTGTGNEATWYATYGENKTDFKAKNLEANESLGLKYAWKFEALDDEEGYKIQSCNLGKYAQLAEAAAVSQITSDKTQGYRFVLTDNGSGKFTIKDGNNKVMRTENNGGINYWDGEQNERWYLIPVPAEDMAMTVTIGATGYSSAYLPVDMALPEGLEAYTVEETTENSAKLTPVNYIAAHQGVILKGTAKQEYTLNVGTADSDFSNNKLKGSVFETYVEGDAYVLAIKDAQIGLYKATLNKDENGGDGETHFKNNAGKAYLPVSAAGARFLLFDLGTETGIEDIEGIESVTTGNATIYDLSGRRVQKAQKGIYIVNGKKVIK